MIMNLLKRTMVIAALSAIFPTLSSAAPTLDFSYNINDDHAMLYHGFNKEEVYDVAIKICNPLLTGSRVTGVSVYIPGEDTQITDCSGWLSSSLKLVMDSGKKVNAPDLASAKGTRDKDGMLHVTFDTPVEIPEEGLYTGYSFKVTELDGGNTEPVAYVAGDNPDGLYIHTTRSISSWKNFVSQIGGVSVMVVHLSGDFPDNAAGIEIAPEVYVPAGEEGHPEAIVYNYCARPIKSIGYSYDISDKRMQGVLTLEEPLKPVFGSKCKVRLDLASVNESGTFSFKLSVDEVNGSPNEIKSTHSGEITEMPFIPVNRPLVEEYTGLWCGYCPRGYVAMEDMSHRYGDRFVGMVYHDNDPMNAVDSYPSDFGGFPSIVFNRNISAGNDFTPENAGVMWEKISGGYALADISVNARLDDIDCNRLQVTSTSKFVKDFSDGRMKISYALVADGLCNKSWAQSNNYSGLDGLEGELWELFTKAGNKVLGLTFNDVVALYNDYNGIGDSLPDFIKADTEMHHSMSIDVSDAFHGNVTEVLGQTGKFRVVAMIIDTATGAVVNANSTGYIEGAGVSSPEDSTSVVAEKYYSLNGTLLDSPVKGSPCLRIRIMSDGRCVTDKIL